MDTPDVRFFLKNNCVTECLLVPLTRRRLIEIFHQLKGVNTERTKWVEEDGIPEPLMFPLDTFPHHFSEVINKTMNRVWKTKFMIEGHDIKVYFCFPDGEKTTIRELEEYGKYIQTWLQFVLRNHALRKECSADLSLYFYMTNERKEVPVEKEMVLNEKHVNTAFTTSCRSKNEIIVYRREEWFKVFIHETFHSLGLDFSELETDILEIINKRIQGLFPVDSKVNLFESYTECLAEIMNCCLIGFFHKEVKTEDDFLSHCELAIHIERNFSVFQMTKVLRFMELEYEDLANMNANINTKFKEDTNVNMNVNMNTKFKEDTNVLAYYIIKTILLYHYNDFFTWCWENNEKKHWMQFKINIKTLNSFCDLIEKEYKKPTILSDIQCSQELLDSKIINNWAKKTMRMTLLTL
jgi:hypothetical protein